MGRVLYPRGWETGRALPNVMSVHRKTREETERACRGGEWPAEMERSRSEYLTISDLGVEGTSTGIAKHCVDEESTHRRKPPRMT